MAASRRQTQRRESVSRNRCSTQPGQAPYGFGSINGDVPGGGLLPNTEINMQEKNKVITEFRTHEQDTGSPDVQIALLSERINNLTEHLQTNRKDVASRRGLMAMVSRRRRLLDYLKRKDEPRYQAVTKKLKLRR